MANVVSYNGNLYTANSPMAGMIGNGAMPWRMSSSPEAIDSYIKRGWISPLSATAGGGTGSGISSNYQKQPFVPNASTQAQLAGMNNMSTPQWMMDAYAQKIGQMGGNANPPVPFNITQSGFPGMGQYQMTSAPSMGGKTAPAGGQ